MFGMRIGIRLVNLGWKLGLEIWDKDWDGYEDGDWGEDQVYAWDWKQGIWIGIETVMQVKNYIIASIVFQKRKLLSVISQLNKRVPKSLLILANLVTQDQQIIVSAELKELINHKLNQNWMCQQDWVAFMSQPY